ncbi:MULTISPECIES: fimbrial protein [Pseudescherichia]|jgi:type 1 fimbria pilin|uniref:fimbrial protein n=1 Tax=Pseudescherichia TaxID=2055880 RepID=UPI0021505B69|nr:MULTISPECIES: fimbrial protein [unclassified Pseudescherichia]MCR4457959.1 fimbrial protein [Pseudescherichia sp. L3]MDF2778894.1 adhesin [Enterobacteriaceae bacterium]WPO96757.1 fimbrial protein [Buttiauxella sp. HR94]
MQSLKRTSKRKSVISYALLILTLCWASLSEASGVYCNARNATSITIDLGNITVPTDLPVGGDITGELSYPQNHMAQCEGSGNFYTTLYSDLPADAVYGGRSTFKTNVPGVGIQMGGKFHLWTGATKDYSGWIANGNTQQQFFSQQLRFFTSPIINVNFGPMFKLVKISDDIESGTLSGKANHLVVSGSAKSTTYTVNLAGTINATPPHVPSCKVDTASGSAFLGTHSPDEFSGPGSTTSFSRLNIPLICERGAQITARVDAVADPSGAESVIQLAPGNESASGVGVQLYWVSAGGKADVPVTFGKDQFIYYSAGGAQTLQFEARYYQTHKAILPGHANASATVTLSYQ